MVKSFAFYNKALLINFLQRLHYVSLVILTLISLLTIVLNTGDKTFIFVIADVAVFFNLSLLNRYKKLQLSARSLMVILWVLLFVYSSLDGGLRSPSIIWLCILPIICYHTLSVKESNIWLVIIVVTFLAFNFLSEHFVIPATNIKDYWYMISYLLFLGVVWYFLRLFYSTIYHKNILLQKMNDSLKSQNDAIKKQQEEINNQIERINQQKEEIYEKNEKLERYLKEILNVGTDGLAHKAGLEAKLNYLISALSNILSIQRVTYWQYSEEEKTLSLMEASQALPDPEEENRFDMTNYPIYTEVLKGGEVMVADDVYQAKETTEFHDYFRENDIKSMLDYGIFIDNNLQGIICCESQKKIKWQPEDIIIVKMIAGLISLSIESERKIKFQDELKQFNKKLESIVEQRTKELSSRSEQLKKSAFFIAHEMRSPICQLMGLKEMTKEELSQEELNMIANYMSNSIDKLDDLSRQASATLEDSEIDILQTEKKQEKSNY